MFCAVQDLLASISCNKFEVNKTVRYSDNNEIQPENKKAGMQLCTISPKDRITIYVSIIQSGTIHSRGDQY